MFKLDPKACFQKQLKDMSNAIEELQSDTVDAYSKDEADTKFQEKLVSGTNIKTVNGNSLLGSGNIVIEGGGSGTTYVAGDGIDITEGVISVDEDVVVTKDINGNVDGILQVEHLQSEDWEEDDDCKAHIYLSSGLRRSTVVLNSDGEESGSTIRLSGTTSVGSEGTISIEGQTNFVTENRLTVNNDETIAYLSEIPTVPNFKTINGQSITGQGDITVSAIAEDWFRGTIKFGVNSTEYFYYTFRANYDYPTGTYQGVAALNLIPRYTLTYNNTDHCMYTIDFLNLNGLCQIYKADGTLYTVGGQAPIGPATVLTIEKLNLN